MKSDLLLQLVAHAHDRHDQLPLPLLDSHDLLLDPVDLPSDTGLVCIRLIQSSVAQR